MSTMASTKANIKLDELSRYSFDSPESAVRKVSSNVSAAMRSISSNPCPMVFPSVKPFEGCSNLTSIVIGNSVTSIGDYAFQSCSALTSIVIPNSVTTIDDHAFYNCSNLTIYCEAESQPSGWDLWWNISSCPVEWEYKG